MRGIIAGILGAFGIGLALWGAIATIERFRRAGQVIDDALVIVCEPCNGKPGRHTCGRSLPGPRDPQPSGAGSDGDTGVGKWTPDELAILRGEKELPR
jgi:hypothetical protein